MTAVSSHPLKHLAIRQRAGPPASEPGKPCIAQAPPIQGALRSSCQPRSTPSHQQASDPPPALRAPYRCMQEQDRSAFTAMHDERHILERCVLDHQTEQWLATASASGAESRSTTRCSAGAFNSSICDPRNCATDHLRQCFAEDKDEPTRRPGHWRQYSH